MLPPVFLVGHSIFCPLGITADEVYNQIEQQNTAIKQHSDITISPIPFVAARLSPEQHQWLQSQYGHGAASLSPFEQMCICAMEQAIEQTNIDIRSKDCIVILSTTKGNIEWLGQATDNRVAITTSAQLIAQHFSLAHAPQVISNACISGVSAMTLGSRLIQNGLYKTAVIVGCDRFSKFVYSGFQSFHALASEVCKPFDANRNGINLGEAAACVVLSANDNDGINKPLAILKGNGASNDANHLSGPSRTGEELAYAIEKAITNAEVTAEQIDAISAHGTATVFNDEMESKALYLAKVNHAALHSLKCYTGHTLGAAGILESIIACMAMQQNVLLGSNTFQSLGVPHTVNIAAQNRAGETQLLLKTASGFGGCNAAIVWEKYN